MENKHFEIGDRYAIKRYTTINAYERTGRFVSDSYIVNLCSMGGGRNGYSRRWEFRAPIDAIAKYDQLVARYGKPVGGLQK